MALLSSLRRGPGGDQDCGEYRTDLLTVVLRDAFTGQGLPAEHGVTMHVREDGQAWRRTPSGQVLGIGMSDGSNNEWLHDAEEPPTGFPGTTRRGAASPSRRHRTGAREQWSWQPFQAHPGSPVGGCR